nr:RNA-directed DNA polymerase, eukaryota, nucleotide-binding alpha-beta plait domain protein [Tanacetum cinerariifolium]
MATNFRSNADHTRLISKSIFVTNFPDNTSSKDLWKLCQDYGTMVDVYILNRKSKARKRFAFVRFIKAENINRLVGNLCTLWIGRMHLHANVVHFERSPIQASRLASSARPNHIGASLFATVLKGNNTHVNASEVPAMVVDDSCVVTRDLEFFVMGEVNKFSSIPNLRVLLSNEGFQNVKVVYLGGLWVMFELDYIKYALTVNPHFYVSCIKQFWNTYIVKQYNDITRLQALVDKKKVVITKATIRDALHLDDATGVDCLPNEEILSELARMGYEKPSTMLTFYKAFFSSQWNLVRNVDSSSKFYMYPKFIQLIIQNQLGDLSTHTTTYISLALTQKVFANMRRVGKGFLRIETPLFEGMLVGVIEEGGDAEEQVQDVAVDTAAQGADTAVSRDDVQHTPPPSPQPQSQSSPQAQPQAADFLMTQALEIKRLKRRVKKLEKTNKVKVLKLRRLKKVGTSQRIDSSDDTVMEDAFNQGRMIDDLDRDTGVALMDDKEEEKKAEEAKFAGDDQVQGRQAKIYKIDMDHASKVLIRVAAASTRRRKRVVIRDPEDELTTIIPAETKSKDNGKGILVEESKPLKKKQQVEMDEEYARKLAIQSINETLAQKAAKKRKLNEEVEDLKQHLEIVPDEDDDVYTEATPLVRKIHVVDYEIINLNNKPHYKIIRADGTHQLQILDGPFVINELLSWCKHKKQHVMIFKVDFAKAYDSARWDFLDDVLQSFGFGFKWRSWILGSLSSGMAFVLVNGMFNAAGEKPNAAKQKMMLLDSAAERSLMLLSQVKTVNDKCCC